jgi:hypothetical protein
MAKLTPWSNRRHNQEKNPLGHTRLIQAGNSNNAGQLPRNNPQPKPNPKLKPRMGS